MAMNAGEADVVLSDVKKWYGGFAAVKGVSLQIGRGEMVSFLGPSGCGKTTTLRMIAGLEELDEGDIRIRGVSMGGVPTHRRNIGMVFQNYALFPHMSVRENIAFGLSMRKTPKAEIAQRVKDVMALIRLDGMAERLPSQLSGGQRQRVALARALVTKPNVLLLDEPLGALDKKLREQMQIEIRMLQKEVGITTIFVTHDQEEALTLSDRIVVMEGGRIVQVGTPREIYQQPADRFVSDFIGMTNALRATVAGRDGDWVCLALQAGGATLRAPASLPVQAGQAVEATVRPENIELGAVAGCEYNGLEGTVANVVYTGALTYVHLDCDAGVRFVALVPNAGQDGRYASLQPGERVPFGWRCASTRLLPAG
ncbi:ABC transporter ATP-binding protein [Orrella sp. JC864]|uniref:ABC transporter ATP-binding protein n=1 Tax=Orrella sp. JC864 TaxID=3120298 RepID=UPI00300A13F9